MTRINVKDKIITKGATMKTDASRASGNIDKYRHLKDLLDKIDRLVYEDGHYLLVKEYIYPHGCKAKFMLELRPEDLDKK